MANLSSRLEQAAAGHGERPAVRMDDLVLSYAELRDAAARVTSLLSSFGIVPGDRVAVMLPNVPAFPIAFYGALAAGAVVVPMNPLLKSREVAYYLEDSGAQVLLAWHAAAGEAAMMMAASRRWRGLGGELGSDVEWRMGDNLRLTNDPELAGRAARSAACRPDCPVPARQVYGQLAHRLTGRVGRHA
jgi:long-subunit acyl-CoA synthetase (AMP-forming)